MTTGIIGIDCATLARKTGLAFGFFENEKAQIDQVLLGSKNLDSITPILEWRNRCDSTLIAIDAPLGWPLELGNELNIHKAGRPIHIQPNQLFRRKTDRFIKEVIGKQPLDVGADRIARTAHAALHLLGEISKRTGYLVPLAWAPTQLKDISAIEVYPAATLLAHKIYAPGYKHKDNDTARIMIINRLREFMELPRDTSLIEKNDDALDAVVCVLAGLDFLNGDVFQPTDWEVVKKEGWIWVNDQKPHFDF